MSLRFILFRCATNKSPATQPICSPTRIFHPRRGKWKYVGPRIVHLISCVLHTLALYFLARSYFLVVMFHEKELPCAVCAACKMVVFCISSMTWWSTWAQNTIYQFPPGRHVLWIRAGVRGIVVAKLVIFKYMWRWGGREPMGRALQNIYMVYYFYSKIYLKVNSNVFMFIFS